MHVDGALVDIDVVAPDAVEQLLAGVHAARVTHQAMHLRPTEYAIFRLLMASQGRVFSREEIVEAVWGKGSDVDVRNVDVHLKCIREALKHPKGKGPVKSVRGLGYRV